MIPTITALCVVGSYAIRNSLFDVGVMLLFGVVGYFAKKFDLNNASIVLALILGPIGEQGLRRSLVLNNNDPSILFSSVISWVLIGLSLISIFAPMIIDKVKKRQDIDIDYTE